MPDDLGELSLLLAPSAGEPGPPPAQHHLAAGRRALRRRRLAVGTATLVALGAVGLGAAVVGQATPGRTLEDPADRPTSLPSRPPSATPPEPSRTADLPRAVADGPDLIGSTRRATPTEAAMLQSFNGGTVMLGGTDGAVVVEPGWRVVDRVDDPAPVAALNRVTRPRNIVDAVAVAVVPVAGTSGRPTYHYIERSSDGTSTRSSEPVGPLSGSLSWWTTARVYAGTPMSNGTPGVDVRLLDDGGLAPQDGAQILESRRDPDVGGFLRAEQTLTAAARVRVADGRILFVVASWGPSYTGTSWFAPADPPEDLDAFLARVRDVYGEEAR